MRILVMPDHPTPITIQTHTDTPVPFLVWGAGLTANGAQRLTEVEASKTNLFIDLGYNIISRFLKK